MAGVDENSDDGRKITARDEVIEYCRNPPIALRVHVIMSVLEDHDWQRLLCLGLCRNIDPPLAGGLRNDLRFPNWHLGQNPFWDSLPDLVIGTNLVVIDRKSLQGSIDLVGEGSKIYGPEEGSRVLAVRSQRKDLAPDQHLPLDTRLWASLQAVGGGTWGGCVYDVEAIIKKLTNDE